MNTDTPAADVESVTMSDILQLNNTTWDRPRSSDELLSFIARREAAISDASEE
jgi:hypothetical protein